MPRHMSSSPAYAAFCVCVYVCVCVCVSVSVFVCVHRNFLMQVITAEAICQFKPDI